MTKPTLIMIHGYRGTHHGLSLVADQLSEFDVRVPDLPGFGEGAVLKQYDLDSYVAWLREYIRASGVEKPFLLGHSFGSIICAAYAAKYPDTIHKLILVNPIGAPALEGPKAILTQLTIFYYWIGRKLPAAAAQKWLASKTVVQIMSSTMTKSRDPALRRYIHDQHHQHFSTFHSAQSVSEGFKTSVSHSVRDYAASIALPTLLIVGEKDDITSLAKQQELADLFPHAYLLVIKNVGHLTHYETPDQVARFVKEFVISL